MEILAFLKAAPNFSFRQGKSYETNVVEEYCWAITVATEQLCCSRSGSSVLEQPGFHLYALVCSYVVEHTYIYICSTNYDPDYIYNFYFGRIRFMAYLPARNYSSSQEACKVKFVPFVVMTT